MCEFRTRQNGERHPIHSGDGQIARMMREAKYGGPRCAGCNRPIEMCGSCASEGVGYCPKCRARMNYGNCRYCTTEIPYLSEQAVVTCRECGRAQETATMGVL